MLNLYYCTKCRTVYAMTEQEASANVRCDRVVDTHDYEVGEGHYIIKCEGKLNKVIIQGTERGNVSLFPKFIPIKENG